LYAPARLLSNPGAYLDDLSAYCLSFPTFLIMIECRNAVVEGSISICRRSRLRMGVHDSLAGHGANRASELSGFARSTRA
jgi:hypothetical protein